MCTYTVTVTTPLLNSPSKQFGGLMGVPPSLCSQDLKQLSGICTSLSSLHILLSIQQRQWAAPTLGASHSRSKEILCKSTGSQRRQDSGQAWQRVCVNSSEQADFAQWSQSQQKAFPGQAGGAVHFRSLASGRPSRTWCTWWKADKPKSQYFSFSGSSSRWLPNTPALLLTFVW